MMKKDSIFARLVASNVIIIVIITLTISFISFYISEKLIINTFTSSNSKMLEQIGSNLIDFHNQVLAISNNVSLNKSIKKFLVNKPNNEFDLFLMLHGMQSYYESLKPSLNYYDLKMITSGINSLSYASNQESALIDFKEIENTYFNHPYLEQRPKIKYSFASSGLTTYSKNSNIIIASKPLQDDITRTMYGVLFITIEECRFSNIYDQSIALGNTISIFSKDGQIISSSDKNMVGKNHTTLYKSAVSILQDGISHQNITLNGTNYIMLAEYVPYLDFYIVNTINRNIALGPIFRIKNFVLILSIFISLLTICSIFFISRKISLPLIEMVKAMSDVKEGNFDQKICIDGSYEVRVLGSTFNSMLDELEKHIKQLLTEQEERRKAELNALQMQINPHFLYNTLSSIKYLSWHGNSTQVSDTINALISLLQNTIGRVDETISIEDEVENLKNYVIIAQTRYGNNIKVSFDVAADCQDHKVPKLILQPFVENAFFHAFKDISHGVIRVYIHKLDNTLFCEIIDSGNGIDPHKLPDIVIKQQQKKHFTGIGIKNVDERIKMLYGNDYGVSIASEKGVGTCVTIALPNLPL